MKNAPELFFDDHEELDDWGRIGNRIWEFWLKTQDFEISFSGMIDYQGILTLDSMSHTQPLKGEFAKQRKEVLFAILETQQDSRFYWARPFKDEPCEVQALTNYIMDSTDFVDLVCKVGDLVQKEVEDFYG